jgi:hypothetical protein
MPPGIKKFNPNYYSLSGKKTGTGGLSIDLTIKNNLRDKNFPFGRKKTKRQDSRE